MGLVRVSYASQVPASHPQREWQSTNGLGCLNKLPVEVLDMIIDQLDIFSLIQISYTCRQGQVLAASFPSYAKLVKHCPETLAVLSQMKLLGLYTCETLEKALHSEECFCCGNFGAFLFLLTCERCCFQCIRKKPASWVLPRAQAAKCFDLSTRQMKVLPTARSIPGKYYVAVDISRSRSQPLVSVRAAKLLAIGIHGFVMTECLHPRWAQLTRKDYASFTMLRRAQLYFPRHDPRMLREESNTVNDFYNGMGTTRFPHLPPLDQSHVDMGSWCRGCKWVWQQVDHGDIYTPQISRLLPQDQHPSTFCLRVGFREWRRAQFLLHARSCYGVQQMEQQFHAGTLGSLDDVL